MKKVLAPNIQQPIINPDWVKAGEQMIHPWLEHYPMCANSHPDNPTSEKEQNYIEGFNDALRLASAVIEDKLEHQLNPKGCHIQIAEWLESSRYRQIMHRHDDLWRAVDVAHGVFLDASTLPLLADALMNWPEGTQRIPMGFQDGPAY